MSRNPHAAQQIAQYGSRLTPARFEGGGGFQATAPSGATMEPLRAPRFETAPDYVRAACLPFRQAARTEFRNLPTSSLRRLLSPDSDCAAERTCDEAEPVSLAPCCTSVMLDETCMVP